MAVVAAALLVLGLAVGALFQPHGGVEAARPAATLLVFLGTAQLTVAGAEAAAPVISGTHLRSGDLLTTGPSSKAEIVFADGSQTRLDGNTTVTLGRLVGDSTGVQVELRQSAGKTWSRVPAGAGRSALVVHGPFSTSAEVMGAEVSFEVAAGIGVGISTWGGEAGVSAAGAGPIRVGTGFHVTVTGLPGGPLLPSPTPAAIRADQFTVFNLALDESQAATPSARSVGPSGPSAVGTGRLSQGAETTVQPGVQVDAAVPTDVVYSLDWPGSRFELVVVDPAGGEYLRHASASPPFSVTVTRASPGQWQFRVHAIESSNDETWVVIVTTRPSAGR